MASQDAADHNSRETESYVDSDRVQSMSVTLSGSAGTVTSITLPRWAKGFRLKPATNAGRFSVGRTPAAQAAKTATTLATSDFAEGAAMEADVWEARLLPSVARKADGTVDPSSAAGRVLKLRSTTASLVVQVELFA